MTETPPAKSRPLRLVLALVGVALVLAAGLTWLNRRTLAREALTGWLRSKGIQSDAQVEAFGPSAFIARLRVGDPQAPDFAAERVEVRYRVRFGGLDVTSVTLRKPVIRAQLRADGLHVGALDPLVQEFLRRPPQPDAAKPRVAIDDGILALATDYGPMRLAADALVEDGKLMSLVASSAPARLRGRDFDLALGAGAIKSTTRGGRIAIALNLPILSAAAAAGELADGRLVATADAPYPDLENRRGDGALRLGVRITAARLASGDQSLADADLATTFSGQASGWIPNLVVSGAGRVDLTARTGNFADGRVGALQASLASDDLAWSRPKGDLVTGALRARAVADNLLVADLDVSGLDLRGSGALNATPARIRLTADLAAQGRGRYEGLGAPQAADDPGLVAIKRAARGFRVAAPAVALDLDTGRPAPLVVRLTRPARLLPDSGGQVQLSDLATPARLTISGGGLPEVDATLSRLELGPNPFADLTVRASASVGPIQDGKIDVAGRVRLGARGASFTADRCAPVSVRRIEFGENDVEAFAGRVCPAGGPVFAMTGGAWRFTANVEAVAASLPVAQVRIDKAAGRITASGAGQRLNADVQIAKAEVSDTGAATRFYPLNVSGEASLAQGDLRASFTARRPGRDVVATARLLHEVSTGRGGVDIETPEIQFADGGLQPVQISPLASAIGSPAVGSAKFQGRFAWSADGVASGGTLTVPGLDFVSPAGPVKGLKGIFLFESLAPLKALPGQSLAVAQVDTLVPVTNLEASFGVENDVLTIAGGQAEVGGGKVRVETLEIPLAPDTPSRGVLILEGVQLHDLVEASPFGDKVEFDAKVSGRLPFEAEGTKIRISGGELKAIQPGRISIDRTALTGVQAEGAIAAPTDVPDPNSTFTDFAYQAMENLAFDTLEATIESRRDGRMGVLFHIVGRHDPPQKQRIRLTLMDLIKRRFLNKPLPLPSGTGVNLTLDTSVNLDDLLADYAEYQKAKNSAPVQP